MQFRYRQGSRGPWKPLVCKECNAMKNVLTKTHMLIVHNMTKEEYCRKHPEHASPGCWGDLRASKEPWKEWKKGEILK